jgi:hypothetical protein
MTQTLFLIVVAILIANDGFYNNTGGLIRIAVTEQRNDSLSQPIDSSLVKNNSDEKDDYSRENEHNYPNPF